MNLVCVDTNIICWGVLEIPPPQNPEFVRMAKDFFRWLDNQKAQIILPTIIIGELLVPIPKDRHPTTMTILSQNFMIVEYDLKAASIFAQIRDMQGENKRLVDPTLTRRELIADTMIIATAIAHQASVIYSHDRHLINVANNFTEGKISAINFLRSGFQTTFLDNIDE